MWILPTIPTDTATYPNGSLNIIRPDTLSYQTVKPPQGVKTLPLPNRPSFATFVRGSTTRTFIAGGHTDNLVFTENKWLLRMGIRAPSCPLVLGAAVENEVGLTTSGTGLTGNCIFALRWVDSLHVRRSPLSDLSPAINLVNQGVAFTNAPLYPIPADPCVDGLEVWVSVDGGLFRHLTTIDAGTSSFTVNETSLGEAETETTEDFPVCKINAIYHDRQALAGDDRHPDRVYFSASEDPENYAGLYISTRNGEPVIGLFVVRDTLVVQCPNIHYYIQGYDENDLTMNILETVGGLGHHTVPFWNDMAVIPGTLDWYMCNGVSMVPLGVGIFDETWRRSLAAFDYKTTAWAATDNLAGIVKLCVRDQSVDIYGYPETNPQTIYSDWVLDLRGGSPKLMFDTSLIDRCCGAILGLPGYVNQKYYSADISGKVYEENMVNAQDGDSPISHILHTAHNVVVEPADDSDCVRFVKGWVIVSNELAEIVFNIYAGNEYAWRAETPNDTLTLASQLATRAITGNTQYLVANDRKIMPLNRCSGSAISLKITCTNTGLTPPVFVAPLLNTPRYGAFVFKGWGASFSGDGEQFRNVEITIPD